MFFILPLPTEDRVRLPVASILYTVLIFAGFYVTWLSGAMALAGEIQQSFPELGRDAQAIRAEVEAKLRPPEALEI